VADILSGLATLGLSLFLVHLKAPPLLFVGAVAVASGIALLVAVILAFKSTKLVFKLDKFLIKNLVKESLPMGAILILLTVDNKIDTVILGVIKGSGPVGIYALAYKVYDVMILGAAYFMSSLLPIISRYSTSDAGWKNLRVIYQKSFDILFLLGGSVLLIVWLGAPFMLEVLTQGRFDEFAEAVPVLRLLAVAMFLAYYNHLTGFTIVGLGYQRSYFGVAAAALIFNIAANMLIIPYYSYYGAAGVTIFNELIVMIATTWLIFKILKVVPSLTSFPGTVTELIKTKGRIF
jgi:O-antigen/teichoic acid export membrane protein